MKRYKGILARPIRLTGVEDFDLEYAKRLNALAAHYGINLKDKRGLGKLVLALAHAHVPGFHVEIRTRPSEKRKGGRDLQLVAHIEYLTTERKMSVRAAAHWLVRNKGKTLP